MSFTNLTVYNKYGSIFYPGRTEVTMDAILQHIHIGQHYISVYEHDSPERGVELNRPAIIRLYVSPDAATRLSDQLRRDGVRSVELVDGVCSFKVDHFTRYGLVNESFSSMEEGVCVDHVKSEAGSAKGIRPLPGHKSSLYCDRELMIADIGTLLGRSFSACVDNNNRVIIPTKNIQSAPKDHFDADLFKARFIDNTPNHSIRLVPPNSPPRPSVKMLELISPCSSAEFASRTIADPISLVRKLIRADLFFNSERLLVLRLIPVLYGNEPIQQLLEVLKDFIPVPPTSSHLDRIRHLLASADVEGACEIALAHNLPRLSLIMSHSSPQECVRLQVITWIEESFSINDDVLRIYLIMAGLLSVKVGDRVINACDDLNWLECLCVFLNSFCDVEEGVRQYRDNGEDLGLSMPHSHFVPPDSLDNSRYLMSFELLLLFAHTDFDVPQLLNPANNSDDVSDFSFCWLVGVLLVSFGALPEVDDCTVRFATQLEQEGHWQWAVFVATFLRDCDLRDILIERILFANVQLGTDGMPGEREEFVLSLGVPIRLLHQAMACCANQLGLYHSEVLFLLRSGHHVKAHHVLANRGIASEMFVTGNEDLLEKYVEEISRYKNNIEDFPTKLGVFREFWYISRHQGDCDNLLGRILSFIPLIVNMTISSPYCRIAQVTMAQSLLRMVCQRRCDGNSDLCNDIISILPLSLQDLSALLFNII